MDDEQKDIALKSLKKANAKFGCETVVQVKSEEGIPFYIAESYHQKYVHAQVCLPYFLFAFSAILSRISNM